MKLGVMEAVGAAMVLSLAVLAIFAPASFWRGHT